MKANGVGGRQTPIPTKQNNHPFRLSSIRQPIKNPAHPSFFTHNPASVLTSGASSTFCSFPKILIKRNNKKYWQVIPVRIMNNCSQKWVWNYNFLIWGKIFRKKKNAYCISREGLIFGFWSSCYNTGCSPQVMGLLKRDKFLQEFNLLSLIYLTRQNLKYAMQRFFLSRKWHLPPLLAQFLLAMDLIFC